MAQLSSSFTLRATLTDGFSVALEGSFPSQQAAERAASRYMRDYSDPCGLGVYIAYVSILEAAR